MKTILTILCLALITTSALAETPSLSTAVQQGLFEEEVNRDFSAAMRAYESAVADFDRERHLAAIAVFRLAENYRRAGRTAEAETLYERILREFHDIPDLVPLAAERLPEERLAALGHEGVTVAVDEEAEEIERLRRLMEVSPDRVLRGFPQGQTYLHRAIARNQLRVARFLIEQGFDIDMADTEGRPPLHFAVLLGSTPAAELLLESGADITLRAGTRGYEIFLTEGDQSPRPTFSGEYGWHPLSVAVFNGHLALAELLIERGADVNAPLSHGTTALHIAVEKGFIRLAELLVERNADLTALNPQMRAPLAEAVVHELVPMIEMLIDRGAEITPGINGGDRPLWLTVYRHDHTEIARLLLSRGGDPNATSWYRTTILHTAASRGNLGSVELLLEYGADINARDHRGRTPLDHVGERTANRSQMIELLRQHGGRPGTYEVVVVMDDREQTVVHETPGTDETRLSAVLSEAGVDVEEVISISVSRPEGIPATGRGLFGGADSEATAVTINVPEILADDEEDPVVEHGWKIEILETSRE